MPPSTETASLKQPKGPSSTEIRSKLDDDRREKNNGKAWSLLLMVGSVNLGSFYGILVAPWFIKPLLMIVNGVSITLLFIIGHDCGHNSYFGSRTLNTLIGQLCFLPSYWILRTWKVAHNYFHHAYACLKTKDHSWVPTDVNEFQGMGWRSRLYARHTKTWLGLATYWLYSIWWRHSVVPRREDWKLILRQKAEYAWQCLSVLTFFAAQIALVIWYTMTYSGATRSSALIYCVAYLGVPFWVYGFFSGLVSLVQHTHPEVVWFKDKQEWNFFSGQVSDSVHFKFPFPVNLLFLDVMEHTAHHVDTGVPVYNLLRQQTKLEQEYPDHITVETYSYETVSRILNTCQLYDYDSHCWVGFDGDRKTEPTDLASIVPAESHATAN